MIAIILILVVRIFEFVLFIKKVDQVCNAYDWKYVENPHNIKYIRDLLTDSDYYVKHDWSAYNFMVMRGPSLWKIFFSLTILNIENIYGKESIERLREYEVI